jgi:iron transport multicopper oxidase
VQQGLRYRIRLVNIACSPNYVFQIDGHTNLTIIEADGITTQPYSVDQITIFAGQRYSFILNADQAMDNYCALDISCPCVCA